MSFKTWEPDLRDANGEQEKRKFSAEESYFNDWFFLLLQNRNRTRVNKN